MKTILKLEIETPDEHQVFPEAGQSDDDFVGKEKELKEFRNDFAKDLHKEVVEHFKNLDRMEESFIENLEELSIEDWESFDDYGIKVKVSADN